MMQRMCAIPLHRYKLEIDLQQFSKTGRGHHPFQTGQILVAFGFRQG